MLAYDTYSLHTVLAHATDLIENLVAAIRTWTAAQEMAAAK